MTQNQAVSIVIFRLEHPRHPQHWWGLFMDMNQKEAG